MLEKDDFLSFRSLTRAIKSHFSIEPSEPFSQTRPVSIKYIELTRDAHTELVKIHVVLSLKGFWWKILYSDAKTSINRKCVSYA